jgi:hypothetical protein
MEQELRAWSQMGEWTGVGRQLAALSEKSVSSHRLKRTDGEDLARYQLVAAATYLADSVALTQIATAR